MTDFNNRSQTSARRSDYVWQYEYYDDEEPVSFEGLRAHRYSIVIGFWVGLAVFVIFMFFVLTLLTKTGAPHQDNPDSEKRPRPGNCALDSGCGDDDNEKACSRPLLNQSRSYFHFYITEEQDPAKQKADDPRNVQVQSKKPGECIANGTEDIIQETDDDGGNPELNLVLDESKTERKCSFVPHFTIPNFVNLDHSSALGEEDLLYEPSVTLERQARAQGNHCELH